MAPQHSGSSIGDEGDQGRKHSPPLHKSITDSPTEASPTSPTKQITGVPGDGESSPCLKSRLEGSLLRSKYGMRIPCFELAISRHLDIPLGVMYYQAIRAISAVQSPVVGIQNNVLTACKPVDHLSVPFLPISAVNDLIRPESVQNYWERLSDTRLCQQCSDVVNYVCGQSQARFVFVIIVLMHEPHLLPGLIRDTVFDNDLPLSRIEEGFTFQLARSSDLSTPVKCFTEWTAAQRQAFDTLQGQVKVEVFQEWSIDPPVTKLPDRFPVTEIPGQSVLPFTKYEKIHNGNSAVYYVEIPHVHHRFKNSRKASSVNGDSPFALKVLQAEAADDFALEVKALMKIKPKPHLATAVTAFKYQKKCHLISKWAEGGDLANFWKTQARDLTHDSICWFAQQCHGLADGLDGIHNASISLKELENDASLPDSSHPNTSPEVDDRNQIHGRHGDIKPQNILWFSDHDNDYNRGVLKITDFGVTAFHSALTTKVPARHASHTITYAAPEIDFSEPQSEPYVSRPFDIWSLGCVFLEFITWILLGHEKLKEFADRRMSERGRREKFREDSFYSFDSEVTLLGTSDSATAKKTVVEWMDSLRDHEDCSPFLREFLDYIQQKMLVEKEKREKSAMVREKLGKMFENCKQCPGYASTRAELSRDGLRG